ncbi:MAG: lamin tail domain-containing protein, partial [Bradymonadaceae bacterium]
YVPDTQACDFGCLNGACLEDVCAGEVCNTPPAPSCEADGQTLVTFGSIGTCNPDTGCQYESSFQTCADACENGACTQSVCGEDSCATTPDDRCDGNTAIMYTGEGECFVEEGGGAACDHQYETQNCTYLQATCEAGVCEGGVEQTGHVVITEYMAAPSGIWGGVGEWFEVVNTSGAPIDLTGWKIRSGGTTDEADVEEHVISDPPSFPTGARLFFANNNDPGQDGSITPDYRYSRFDIILNSYSDWIAIVSPEGDVADIVFWEPGSIIEGRSRKLNPEVELTAGANDDYRNWCPSLDDADVYGAGDQNFGRPGLENSPCAPQPCADVVCEKPDDYCSASGNAVQYQLDATTCLVTRFNNPWCNFEPETVTCTNDELCFDGACENLPTNLPEPGELVITEVMGNPSIADNVAEWIEIYNRSDRELTLFTLYINDNEEGLAFDSYQVVDRNAVVSPGEYIVFVRNVDASVNGGVEDGFYYNGSHLKNSPGEGMQLKIVREDGVVVSAVHYGTPTTGVSQQLSVDFYKDVNAFDPAVLLAPESWCNGESAYGDGDLGTPGADNLICPI